MGSCLQEILCYFSEEYSDYLFNMCEQPELILDIIRIAEPDISEKYIKEDCLDLQSLREAEVSLTNIAQYKFRARLEGKERSQTPVPEWIDEDNASFIISNFEKLNILSDKYPKFHQYECVALFGSTAPNIEQEFRFLVYILRDIKIYNLYLLTGTRVVDQNKYNDGPVQYIESVKEKYKVSFVMEIDLMEDLYDRICRVDYECNKLNTKIVNAVKKQGRATTFDTLKEFQLDIKNCSEVLYISRAPFILYQNEVVSKFSKNIFHHRYETIGNAAIFETDDLDKTKLAHRLLMSFAEALFEARARIQDAIEIKYLNEDL